MRRTRGYSATMNVGKYPIEVAEVTFCEFIMSIICCRNYANTIDYDSDSSADRDACDYSDSD